MALWAWTTPAWFKDNVLDHTWVTNYDNRLISRPSAIGELKDGQLYWFCWGDFHAIGDGDTGGLLRSQDVSRLDVCQALVAPDLPSADNPCAQGTIFHYGIDGVCHQLANQVLWATGLSNGGNPMTVTGAKGYCISSFLFGTYGHLTEDTWQQRIAKYEDSAVGPNAEPDAPPTGLETTDLAIQMPTQAKTSLPQPSEDDDFSVHAKKQLNGLDKDAKFKQLHALRMQHFGTLDLHRMRASSSRLISPSPEELNAHYTEVLRQAATFLNAKEFKDIFGIDPNKTVALVPPSPTLKP